MPNLVSIIVPIYNAETYLVECLQSILSQTYSNYEVILVDDGSSDGSAKICDIFAEKTTRVKVIHQINKGVTCARKKGLEISRGEWITFIDADDTIPEYALSRFAEFFCDETDIIIGSVANKYIESPHYNIEEYRNMLISGTTRVGAWGKMMRRSLFNDHVFDIPREIKLGEDMLMHIRLAFNSYKKVVIVPYPNHVYNYRSHSFQTTKVCFRTLDYEDMFHIHLMKSIPEDKHVQYLNATIKSRINALKLILDHSLKIDLYDHIFYKTLLNDIKDSGVNLNWYDNLLVCTKNPVVQKLLVYCAKIYHKLR